MTLTGFKLVIVAPKNLILINTAIFLFVCHFLSFAQANDRKKPNVIVILTDDQGSVDVNSYGAKDLYTPNMDRLASEGIQFTQFYAAAPVCSPSRAALMTGKTNLRAGLPNNVPIPERAAESGQYGLPAEEITMAEMLKNSGYYTALIGKWHLGHREQNLPNGQGFDYFFGHQRGCIDNYSHFFFWDGPNKHDLYRNAEEVYYPGRHFSDLMVDEVKEVIDKNKEQPFFIYWAFNAPHYPYQGEPKWLDRYKDLPTPRKEYAAFLSSMDEKIGNILDYLDELGLTEDTIVIFQSDHGHSLEERAFWGGGNAGPYRGSKFSMFEGGIRVPAIIRYPKMIPADQVRDQVATEMDWFSTIADLTESQVSEVVDGKSLMPIILNKETKSQHEVVHWQLGSYDDKTAQWAIRKGPWKLMGNVNEPLGRNQKIELPDLFLVDLDKDASEQNNLAETNPEKLKELLELHKVWLKSVRLEKGK